MADIFCGSGTTLVEALMLGRHAIGVDASPLACLISDAKTSRFVGDEASLLLMLAARARICRVYCSYPDSLFPAAFQSSLPARRDAIAFG